MPERFGAPFWGIHPSSCSRDFFFTARDDDVILAAGYRIGPFDVESVLITHPSIVDVAVVGQPDEVRGEVVVAYVVLDPAAETDGLEAEGRSSATSCVSAPTPHMSLDPQIAGEGLGGDGSSGAWRCSTIWCAPESRRSDLAVRGSTSGP